MSESILKLLGGAILAVTVLVILRKENADIASVAKMCAGVMLAVACVASMSPIVEYAGEIAESVGAEETVRESAMILLKALGISILTHITATVCRDAGEGSIAYYVEMGGRIEMILLSMPLLREMINVALELLEMS